MAQDDSEKSLFSFKENVLGTTDLHVAYKVLRKALDKMICEVYLRGVQTRL